MKRGSVYTGPTAYIDPAEAAIRGIVPGHYAMTDDGRKIRRHGTLRRRMRLVAVDEHPGRPDRDGWHVVVAGRRDPIAKAGRPVELDSAIVGRSRFGA